MIDKIVILGGGSAGWMTAAALSNAFGKTKQIVLVESNAIGTVGVGEATIPLIESFNTLLGIKEQDFLSYTNGTFKLGIKFENWGGQGESYIHPFGIPGKDSWMANFQHFWLRGQQLGVAKAYSDYSINIRAAEAQKFAKDSAAGLAYAYHFDAGLYAKLLRTYSEAKGVKRVEGKVQDVQVDTTTGYIQELKLESGEVIGGDLFIDCSGFAALLSEKTLNTEFEDWSHWLPCDRAWAVQTDLVEKPAPYTRSIAHAAGWQWRIPLQHRMGNGCVFSSRYMSEEKARELLLGSVEGGLRTEPRLVKFKTGRSVKQWNKNCVSIGLASGFLEPLESTSLHLIQSAVTRLIRMLPADEIQQPIVDEYNRQSKFEYETIRDFIILHYCVTSRTDSDFWNYCRTMDLPQTLQNRIDIYKHNPSVFREHDELFHEGSWQAVMLGQGLQPKTYHPVVNELSEAELVRFLQSIDNGISQRVAQYPSHTDFIKNYCPPN
ncbi:tryptophan halogenase family protein [Saccharophagus degradans]|uniref:Tryptophan 7-halogenase n=1 Tax=Saccharophagus degradans TaxID=86304 RepID=A0AAW7X5X8_9GAMM|nr:tryptophan halogenase family protein [Saccharophagus degradans]MDO6421933.1 tryptophan 7-halogenase [Saccharophagus degradans]MDO6606374.1 tryptophan 7-halogenase [Saccharophagus degradans]